MRGRVFIFELSPRFVVTQGRGSTPPAQDAKTILHNERRSRKISVGVDAPIDPAVDNRKIARTIGENKKRFVGTDASVRPWGNRGFAAMFHKNGRASYGSMWASTPTNVLRFRIGAPVFACAFCRADRVVRPYGCVRVYIGAREFATLYCAGGVEPLPYGNGGGFCGFALVRSNLRARTAQSFRHGFAVPPPFTQGRL